MARNNTDPRVDAYIDTLPGWQQAICRKVRGLAHAADPHLIETIKRTRQDVSFDGQRFFLLQERERPPEVITQMIVVQHWFEELKRLVPTK
jgi:hypothetical protein